MRRLSLRTLAFLLASPAIAAAQSAPMTHANRANWQLSDRFSTQALRSLVYTNALQPRWIGETDSMFYYWKDHTGSRFFLVVPALNVKRPLFDHAKLAAALTTLGKKPYDALTLPFTTLNFTK